MDEVGGRWTFSRANEGYTSCGPMRDTSIVGIDGADNRTLQHFWTGGPTGQADMGSSQGTISGEEQAQESGCMDAKLQALYMHGHAQPDADAETQHTQRKKERPCRGRHGRGLHALALYLQLL
uniref:Uncharacterized protein n=2 Tax=Oryza TaxID=4527 RepID=Q69JB5_ORYSJ|nr:hypothetical protein [Oryza sativa Japonica Group]